MVEFAMVLIVLLMFVFIVFEGGNIFKGWLTVQNAARAGGRYAITGNYDPSCLHGASPCADPRVFSIETEARIASAGLPINPAASYSQPGYYQIEVMGVDYDGTLRSDFAGVSGAPVVVRVTYQVPVITPLFRPMAQNVRVIGQVVMNNENYDQVSSGTGDQTAPILPPIPTPGPPSADLSITKTDDFDPAIVGTPLNYALQVVNHGPLPASGVVVTDTLPVTVQFASASTSGGSCNHAAGKVTCQLNNLAVGAGTSIAIQVVPTTIGSVTNVATVRGLLNDPDLTNNTASEETGVVDIPTEADLALSKSVWPNPVVVNQPLTYTLAALNNGLADATGITIVDTLPPGVTFVSGAGCSAVGQVVTCTVGSLARGAGRTIVLNTTAPSTDGLITNTAAISGDQPDPDSSNNVAAVTSQVLPLTVDLTVSIVDTPDPVRVGNSLAYVISVLNQPGLAAASGVNLAINLPADSTFVSATTSQGTGCLPPVGRLLTCNLGSLASGANATATVNVLPIRNGTITLVATAASNESEINIADNSDTESTLVESVADLSITKTSSPNPVTQGNPLAFTLTVVNNGPSPATNIVVTDPLPATVSYVSAIATPGSCTQANRIVTCNIISLTSGASAVITINVIPTAAGFTTNAATVAATEYDPNTANNSATSVTTVSAGVTPFITLNPVCGPAGIQVTVNGYNWSTVGNRDLTITWDPTGPDQTRTLLTVPNFRQANWSRTVTIPASASDNVHTIRATRFTDTANASYKKPCPAPNLVLTVPELVTALPIATGQPVSFRTTVRNTGDLDVNSQFFVGLYFDPNPPPVASSTNISQTFRAGLVAVSGLSVGASRVVTITAPAGFAAEGPHQVYIVADSEPAPTGSIPERVETDNIAGPLTVTVSPPPSPTPGPTPTASPSPTPGATPMPGTLSGQAFITAAGGQLLPQANVLVNIYDAISGSQLGTTYTMGDGSYLFMNLAPGTLTINACINIDGVNYFYTITGVLITPGGVTEQDLFLAPGVCP